MRRRAFTKMGALVFVVAIICLATVAIGVSNRIRDNLHHGSCSSNLKQIGLGFIQYTQDYNEKLPILTTDQGWVDALQPYVKSTLLFSCPQEKSRGTDNLTDYWFNRRLASVDTRQIVNPAVTLMSGDGEPSDDPNASLAQLPPRWITNANSPARRHLDGANYGFADGHVKWFKADAVAVFAGSKNAPTFLIR